MSSAVVFPSLETARLRLREVTSEDAEALFAIRGDPERMRWFGSEPLSDLEAVQDLIKVFAGLREDVNLGIRWAIEVRDKPGLIGTCGLFGSNRKWRRSMLGYELARSSEGYGFMTEALRAAIGWGFKNMELNRIDAQVHPENKGSSKLLEKLGFEYEGRLRQLGYWSGAYHDMLQYGLLKHDWATLDHVASQETHSK